MLGLFSVRSNDCWCFNLPDGRTCPARAQAIVGEPRCSVAIINIKLIFVASSILPVVASKPQQEPAQSRSLPCRSRSVSVRMLCGLPGKAQ